MPSSTRGLQPATVSVVIPARNAAKTIGLTLRSLAGERPVIHEVIVVDDDSDDDTATIAINCAADLDLPLVVLASDCRDAGEARNRALARASGRWVYFLDADDLHHEGGLRALVAAGEAADAPDLILGGYHCRRTGREPEPFAPLLQGLSAESYLAGRSVVIVVGSALIARAALQGLRFHGNLAYDEDTLFWAALLAKCRIAAVDAVVMTYNVSLARADDWLAVDSRERFQAWRRCLSSLEARGIRRRALRRREAFMAIKVARVHLARGETALAHHFLGVAWRTPKTAADTYRWLRIRLKLALRTRSRDRAAQ